MPPSLVGRGRLSFRERYARDTAGVSIAKGYSPVSLCLALFDCASHTERSMISTPRMLVFGGEWEGIMKTQYTSLCSFWDLFCRLAKPLASKQGLPFTGTWFGRP